MSAGLNVELPVWAAPSEVPLELGPLQVTVRPCDVGQITRMVAVAAPAVDALMALPVGLLDRLQQPEQLAADDLAELFELLSKHPAKLAELVAIATRLRVDEVQALLPDRYAFLFAVVVVVNADFFSRATPAFEAAGRVLQQLRPSSDSSAATPGPAPSGS